MTGLNIALAFSFNGRRQKLTCSAGQFEVVEHALWKQVPNAPVLV